MASELWGMGVTELAEAIRQKQVSSREVIQAHLDRIEAINPTVHAVTVTLAERALAAADKADQQPGDRNCCRVASWGSYDREGKYSSCGLSHDLWDCGLQGLHASPVTPPILPNSKPPGRFRSAAICPILACGAIRITPSTAPQ